MPLDSNRPFIDKPLVNVNETTLTEEWQKLFCTETPLQAENLYIPQSNSPSGGYFTPIISILLVALLAGLLVLIAFEAAWPFYLLWVAITIIPHFFLWPRYLAHLEKENAQLVLERFGLFLLPQALLIRESFHSPNCTLLPRTMVSGAAVITRQRYTRGIDTLMQIRYQDTHGQEQRYETLWVPDRVGLVMDLITDWAHGVDVWDSDLV